MQISSFNKFGHSMLTRNPSERVVRSVGIVTLISMESSPLQRLPSWLLGIGSREQANGNRLPRIWWGPRKTFLGGARYLGAGSGY